MHQQHSSTPGGLGTAAHCLCPFSAAAATAAAADVLRLAKCLRCQSGLEEPLNSGLTDGQRDSKRTVCSEFRTGSSCSEHVLC
jgi:hypothetical protein